MGVVYEAFDPERNRRVAIKTLNHLEAEARVRLASLLSLARDEPRVRYLGDQRHDGALISRRLPPAAL
jgi:hypothetical protein